MLKKLIIYLITLLSLTQGSVFIDINPTQAIDMIENGTGILIFESDQCPWCNKARPILEEVAKESGIKVYSANIQDIKSNPREGKEGTEEYKKILELLNEYLNDYLDEDGNSFGEKRVYIPDVYAIKDGKILGHNLGTVKSHTDKDTEMTEEEKQELREIYKNLIESVYKNIE